MYKYSCNRCGTENDQSFRCGYCGWGDLYPIRPPSPRVDKILKDVLEEEKERYPKQKVDPAYDADFPGGTKWYDYALSGALIAAFYPFAVAARAGRFVTRLIRRR